MKNVLLHCLLLSGAAMAPGSASFAAAPPLPPIRLPNGGSGLTDRLPYTQWTTHLGPATQALVTAEIAIRDDTTRQITTQTGSGILVRCDGLVLLPACLFYTPGNADRTKGETVMSVTIHTGNAPTFTTLTADLPRYRSPEVPYVLVKVRDHHFRAAALLRPQNLSASRTVEVVYRASAGKEDRNRVPKTVSAKVQVIETPEGTAALTFGATPDRPAPKLPPGAIVIDTESQMAIGMYAPPDVSPGSDGDAAAPAVDAALTTFARLHDISNAFGLVPRPDDRLGTAPAARKPGQVQEGMVWIPGGALQIDPLEWPELRGAVAACTPGFWIDRTEVTVREYRTFLRETKYQAQGTLPRGATPPAAPGEPAAPETEPGASEEADPDSLPIRGVTVADAEAYAAWANKRLVTPLEWRWATRGAGMAPPDRFVPERPALPGSQNPDTGMPALPDVRMQTAIRDVQKWVRDAAPSWPAAYERVLNEAESSLRLTALLRAYEESQYWGYWQTFGNPGRAFPGGRVPPSYQIPEFIAAVDSLTPRSIVLDPKPFSEARYSGSSTSINGVTIDNMGLAGIGVPYGFSFTFRRKDAMTRAEAMLQEMFAPLPIAPVGSRRYDRSVFDVRDVGTNLPEWIQANQADRPREWADKLLPPLFDPVVEPNWREVFQAEMNRRMATFTADLNGGDRFNLRAIQANLVFPNGPYRNSRSADNPFLLSEDFNRIDVPATALRIAAYPIPLLPFLRLSHPENAPVFGNGFRCAR